jgi:hypothetical protein
MCTLYCCPIADVVAVHLESKSEGYNLFEEVAKAELDKARSEEVSMMRGYEYERTSASYQAIQCQCTVEDMYVHDVHLYLLVSPHFLPMMSLCFQQLLQQAGQLAFWHLW